MLKTENLYKSYSKTKKDNFTLNNISFELDSKGLVFIIGESGAGKTTLLNIIDALDNPTSGDVIYNNENICKYNDKEKEYYRKSQVGFIFQEHNLFSHLTVKDNIILQKMITMKINIMRLLNYLSYKI